MSGAQKLSRFRSAEQFAERLAALSLPLEFDAELLGGSDAPLARSLDTPCGPVGNRFAILPMEGWDATPDGRPTDLVRRRWRRFGESGAKLVWGGEAVAVRADGRANPHQLLMNAETAPEIAALRRELVSAHEAHHGEASDLRVGLQLTHSGRFARPDGTARPRTAVRHPVLDARVGIDSDASLLGDAEFDEIVDAFVAAAVHAQRAGFDFVDVKHCHGYLGHELLSAVARPGRYGGDLAGRTQFLRRIVAGVRSQAPDLAIGVRLSVFDVAPYRAGPDGIGVPEDGGATPFGGDASGGIDLSETHALLDLMTEMGIGLLCTTAGSPYYNPHIQRPAFFPPSDGYRPPEDPLVGVSRQITATRELAARHPELVVVGSAYSYLQEWLPHVAQHTVRTGAASMVGIGRMALSYPTLPADVLAGRPLARRLLCRTFSDCTTAPRGGLVSGCYPLDDFYRQRPEAARLAELKRKG